MFEIFVGTRFKFMEKRRFTYILSILLVLASLGSLIAHGGPRESIDFTGGNLLYVKFDQAAPVGDVRTAAGTANLEGAEVQMAEENTQAIIHFRTAEGDTSNQFENFKRAMESEGDFTVALMSQEILE